MDKEKYRCPVCNKLNNPIENIPFLVRRQRMTKYGIELYYEEKLSFKCEFCGTKWKETNELFNQYVLSPWCI